MTGVGVGLLTGVGLVLVLAAVTVPPRPATGSGPGAGLRSRVDALVAAAGLPDLGAGRVMLASVLLAVLAALLVLGVTRSVVLASLAGPASGWVPFAVLRRRAAGRAAALRAVWPDVVDDLASAVRAGLGLPDALAQLGVRGDPVVAPAFARFAADYRATGRFGESLDALKDRLADPVADRIVEALRLAREVGGSDLGRLLRSLSVFLREDARTRGELETRQDWTVNGARVAAAAPWVTLALLATRPEAVDAFDSGAGVLVLLGGATVTVVAYRLMLRIGRLPVDPRVLR